MSGKIGDYFFLFESNLITEQERQNYCFSRPLKVIKVTKACETEAAFREIEKLSLRYYLCGYFSYELGYYFEEKLRKNSFRGKAPLIHLAVFDSPRVLSKIDIERKFPGNYKVSGLGFNFKKEEYRRKVSAIKRFIKKGDTYQVNFTGKYSFRFRGSPYAFYRGLAQSQPVPYSAFCKMNDEYVISLSPELFLRRENDYIYSRPMKGTISRGKNLREDKEARLTLFRDAKNRAENLMIVDLIRNDLGRISRTGKVKTGRVFEIEKYNTLFQMTSTVSARLKRNINYFEIFKNIFPGGSVTGAPKIKTMQIIRQLEKGPRGVYCGALGIIFPRKRAVFNLPIRTITLNGNRGQMGVGSGIVIDSDPENEFNECVLKARFLTEAKKDFQLRETILWDNGYRFLAGHLKRLKNSAQYFSFEYKEPVVRKQLNALARKFKKACAYRVRMLMDRHGVISFESAPINQKMHPQTLRIAISKHKVDADNVHLYHKTTRRQPYDSEHAHYYSKGFFDVVFKNTKNEFTEGAISNIIIEKEKQLFTPPVSSGLLPGVYRSYLIQRCKVKEKKLFLKDLREADKVFLCNSVRGMVEVRLES